MPPPSSRNPAPRTAAAKAALAHFYCDLCGKGYARMNEWEAHEGSYDHQHKKRLKEMKAMSKDPGAGERARRAEEKSAGFIAIKPLKLGAATATTTTTTSREKHNKGEGGDGGGRGFKKAGFKSAFGGGAVQVQVQATAKDAQGRNEEGMILESESEEDDEAYDPRLPTECLGDCKGRMEVEV